MKKIYSIILLLLLISGCKKEKNAQPQIINYTIELTNCPQGLDIEINGIRDNSYQQGTNVYQLKTGDEISVEWNNAFWTCNFTLKINGITDYYINNGSQINYHKILQ